MILQEGTGISMTSLYITESGAFIRKDGGRVIIGRNQEVLMEVPLEKIEDICVIDSVHLSSKISTYCLRNNIPITWLSSTGSYFGTLMSTSNVDVLKHEKQFALHNNKEFYMLMSKRIVNAKINNQLVTLKRYARNVEDGLIDTQIANIKSISQNVTHTTTRSELMGVEGIIARFYFEALGKVVPESYAFTKRSKRPPKDPFNALLSLGYSMLFNEILSAVVSAGLHPFVGNLHTLSKGHPALVSDLIEEYRAPIIDSLVMNIVKRNMIDSSEFTIEDEGCYLKPAGRKVFLQSYNKKLRSENQYGDTKCSYRELIRKQCKSYATAIMHEDVTKYVPLKIY